MAIVFDPAKSRRNERERNLPFELAEQFDFATAYYKIDDREDYGELRIRAVGFLNGSLHMLVFTERDDDTRILSLRRANRAEMREYDENQA
jgi:uncharacterized DUF497 family protein